MEPLRIKRQPQTDEESELRAELLRRIEGGSYTPAELRSELADEDITDQKFRSVLWELLKEEQVVLSLENKLKRLAQGD